GLLSRSRLSVEEASKAAAREPATSAFERRRHPDHRVPLIARCGAMPARELEMAHRAKRGVFCGSASALMLLLLADVAAAQKSQILKNLELCNGVNRTSPDIQIDGCTALINSGAQTPRTRVIAYNNRGNAYMAKGEYDRAVQDYDQSIELNP